MISCVTTSLFPSKKKKSETVFGCLRFFFPIEKPCFKHLNIQKMGDPVNRVSAQGSGRFPPATYTVEAAPTNNDGSIPKNSFGARVVWFLNGASVFRVWSSLFGGGWKLPSFPNLNQKLLRFGSRGGNRFLFEGAISWFSHPLRPIFWKKHAYGKR